jgi:hypothetical protein
MPIQCRTDLLISRSGRLLVPLWIVHQVIPHPGRIGLDKLDRRQEEPWNLANYPIDFKFMQFPAPFQVGTTLHHARGNIRISG